MNIRLVVCTPAYDGNVNHGYMLSFLELERKCAERNITLDIVFTAKESLITRARNYLCDKFMKVPDATHLLFIDADIQFNTDDILRMVDADVPLIGGVYPKKTFEWKKGREGPVMNYVVVPWTPTDVIPDVQKPQSVMFVGTGMMLIKREVLESMMASYPDDWYDIDDDKYFKFFDCAIHDKAYLSEDYYFCHRWRKLGGTVYAAYWTRSTHWGLHGYEGDIVSFALKLAATS